MANKVTQIQQQHAIVRHELAESREQAGVTRTESNPTSHDQFLSDAMTPVATKADYATLQGVTVMPLEMPHRGDGTGQEVAILML
jgi:hypothetical protein